MAHGHSSQPSITLTPDDDSERSECKRARMEGAVGVEGSSGVGMGVAGTGGNEMDSEDSKLYTPVSLTGTPYSRPRSDFASVWASGGDGGLSDNPGAAAAANWERRRSGSNYGRMSLNRIVLVPAFFLWVLRTTFLLFFCLLYTSYRPVDQFDLHCAYYLITRCQH